MTIKITMALAAACAVAAIATTAAARETRSASCSATEGSVLSYVPTAGRQCGAVVSGATLFRTETVHTAAAGGFTFRTNHIHSCRESGGSSDELMPSASVALLHLTGTTWCVHRPGDKGRTLAARNAKILTTGTTVGMSYSKTGLTVKLEDGSARVTQSGSSRSILVPSGSQLFVPFTGRAEKPTPAELTPDDQLAVVELRLDVLGIGSRVLGTVLRQRRETSAVLIGDSPDTLAQMQKTLTRAKTATFTFDQVNSEPGRVETALKELRTHVVVTAGPFPDASAIWDTLRTTTPLPEGASLFYVE